MNIEVISADYQNENHTRDLIDLLNAYALDPMGGGEPLSQYTKENLIEQIRTNPIVFSVLCYVEGKPAGLVNCIEGFSTFAARPLVNIHDVVVLKEFRGLGISTKMLEKVEEIAVDKGACKLTMEVLEGNKVAQSAYRKVGFSGYELDPEQGAALFWQKKLA